MEKKQVLQEINLDELDFDDIEIFPGGRMGSSEEKSILSAVFESIRDAVYYTDMNRRIIDWNTAAEKLTGYKKEEVLGRRCSEFLKHTDAGGNNLCSAKCPILGAVDEGKSYTEEIWIKTKSGESKPVEVSCSLVRDRDGTVLGAVEVFRDRTEQKQLEKFKEEFFSSVTHDLKTPLASIMGFVDLLMDPRYGEICEKKIGFSKSIRRTGRMLTNLINNIVDATRIKAGKLQFNLEPLSLGVLLMEVRDIFSPLVKQKDIKLELKCPENLWIMADRQKLNRVFLNLLGNAFRFTPKKGLMSVEVLPGSKNVEVRVSDSGPGIPPAQQKKIFKKFTQAEGESRGAGLGLFVVKSFVEGHGTEIYLESKPGEGTIFSFYLERAVRAEKPEKDRILEETSLVLPSGDIELCPVLEEVRDLYKPELSQQKMNVEFQCSPYTGVSGDLEKIKRQLAELFENLIWYFSGQDRVTLLIERKGMMINVQPSDLSGMEASGDTQPGVLVICPLVETLNLLKLILSESGYEVTTATGGREGLVKIEEHRPVAVIISPPVPDVDTKSFIDKLEQAFPGVEPPLIFLSSKCPDEWDEYCRELVPFPIDRALLNRSIRRASRTGQDSKTR